MKIRGAIDGEPFDGALMRRATARTGSGLAGLTDRVAAAGGALQVRSAPGRGTLVEAVLPCAS